MNDDMAITPRGSEIPVRYGLVEMGDLVTSHDDSFNANPAFPAELQPRDRSMLGAMARNYQLEQEMNPKLLMSDVNAAGGAPVIAPDGVVESGNGRVIALRRSAAEGRTDAYQRYKAALEAAGYDTTGMQRPVLVRMRTEPLTGAERASLARDMNADVTERMSAREQAAADTSRISDDDLAQTENPLADRAFQRSFLAKVAPDQINQLVGPDGNLSPEGRSRIRNAVVARAYGRSALGDAAETGPAADRSDGLAAAAPAWARMRALAANGEIPRALDVSANLQSALDMIRAAREAGQALGRYLADRFGQLDAFSGEAISPETEAFLRILYRDEGFTKPRKPGEIAAALSDYARQAMAVTPGPNLFGETADGSTARQIHRGLNERFASGDAGRIDLRAPGKAEQPAEPQAGVALLDLPAPRGEGRDGGGQGLRPENGAETPAAQQEPRAGPSARLTGEEIAPLDADQKALIAAAKDFYETELRPNPVYSSELGGEVQFGTQGRKHALSGSPDKFRLIAALPDVIASGRLVKEEPDRLGRRSILAVRTLEAVVEMGDKPTSA